MNRFEEGGISEVGRYWCLEKESLELMKVMVTVEMTCHQMGIAKRRGEEDSQCESVLNS